MSPRGRAGGVNFAIRTPISLMDILVAPISYVQYIRLNELRGTATLLECTKSVPIVMGSFLSNLIHMAIGLYHCNSSYNHNRIAKLLTCISRP